MNNDHPTIDPKVIEFLDRAGFRLIGRDSGQPGRLVWRREPIAEGEQVEYEISTAESLRFDDPYFLVCLFDSIYEGAFHAGRSSLKRELKRLLE